MRNAAGERCRLFRARTALGTQAHKFSVSACITAQSSLSPLDDADGNQKGWGMQGCDRLLSSSIHKQ